MKLLLTGLLVVMLALPVLAAGGDGTDYLRRGESCLSAGDYRKALKAFTEAARLMPDSAEAYRGIGLSRLRLGANEAMTDPAILADAAAAFTTALLVKPDFAEVHYLLGLTYLALDNRDRSRQEFEALEKLDPALAGRLLASIGTYQPVPAFREVGSKGAAEDNVLRVAISGNQVVVPATISYGDRAVQAQLLLDTGASSTIISPEIAARLGITSEQTVIGMAQVVGGAILQTGTVKLRSITVGPRTRTGLNVHIVRHNGPPVGFDGLLGMDFLRGLTYHIDFQRGLITWGP